MSEDDGKQDVVDTLSDLRSSLNRSLERLLGDFREYKNQQPLWARIVLFWLPFNIAISLLISQTWSWIKSTLRITTDAISATYINAGLQSRLLLILIGLFLIGGGILYSKLLTIQSISLETLRRSGDSHE